FHDPPPTRPSPLSLHDALPISAVLGLLPRPATGSRMIVHLPRSGCAMKIIKSITGRFTPKAQAMRVLEQELQEFAYDGLVEDPQDRKSTRLNSSHVKISYAVFC